MMGRSHCTTYVYNDNKAILLSHNIICIMFYCYVDYMYDGKLGLVR